MNRIENRDQHGRIYLQSKPVLGVQARPGIRKSCHSEAERGVGISLRTTLAGRSSQAGFCSTRARTSYSRAFFLIRSLAMLALMSTLSLRTGRRIADSSAAFGVGMTKTLKV